VQQVLYEKMKGNENANRLTAKFFLQPIDDIHLHSQLTGEMQPNGNAEVVNALQIVAFVILVLALINYINLSVARAVKRSKEIGVRKIIGSSQRQLSMLFFTESFLINLIGFMIAMLLVYLLSDTLSMLSGKSVNILIWTDPVLFFSLAFGVLILFSLIAGFYPARMLSSFSPVVVMKKSVSISGGKGVRSSLLVIQFLITIVLVTMTMVIKNQISFMQNQELGFNLYQNVVIKSHATTGAEMDTTFINRMEFFKSRIKENNHVVNATITSNIPGRENEWTGRLRRAQQDKELISTFRTRVDKDFVDTYGLSLLAGRNFSSETPDQVILNQSTAKMLGYKSEQEAIGNKLMGNYEIVGVVKDFHERSIHEPITPAIYTTGQGYMKFITVNINASNFNETLSLLNHQWKSVFPDKPFDYFLLDEFFNRQYSQEQRLSDVFQYFSAVGLGIACLGLFGFTYFITHQRTKEIGIRKTLGASLKNIVQLLSSELALLLLIAGVLAGPVSYYLADLWLSTYPVKAMPDLVNFVLPVLMVSFFAFTSIIILLIRSAQTNPVEALKQE
jgi:putative ABC transport system permease protein